MRPGLRLVFDSVEGDPFSVGALMQIWAGDLLEEDHSPDLLKYEVSSKPRDGAVQKTLVQIKTAGEDEDTDNPARTIVLFEVAMMLEEGEEGERLSLDPPHLQTLLPQAVVSDIVSEGHWHREGVEMRARPKKVGFDDVDDWWGDVCNEASMVPQVIVGTHLSGDYPSRDPDPLAQVLAGLANVHYAATPATMERMNEVMGKMKAPRGSIRMLLANPSDDSKPEETPLYSVRRMKAIEDDLGLLVEHHIFLRLAGQTLAAPLPDWTNETIVEPPVGILDFYLQRDLKERLEGEKEKEGLESRIDSLEKDLDVLDEAYHSAAIESQNLKRDVDSLNEENKSLMVKNSDLRAALHEAEKEEDVLRHQLSGFKAALTEKKKDFKDLQKKYKQETEYIVDVWPALRELIKKEGLKDMEEVATRLKALSEIEQEEVDEEEIEDETVHSVLKNIAEQQGDKFAIAPSAFKSAQETAFEIPRRVREAFSMMIKSYDLIRNRARSGQSLDYSKTFRQHADGPNFDVANSESSETMKKFGGNRSFEFDGEKFDMQPHIKIGNSPQPGKTLRIHFLFDSKREKFLIGHCGKHLPTAGG